jgi:spore maturation protein CgeB
MRVLFVGFKYDYGIISRGESLEIKAFYPAIEKNADEVDAFWIEEHGYPNNKNILQRRIINYADNFKPDLIFFILIHNEIYKETILYLSSKYKTLNWFCDDQWRFDIFSISIANYFTYCVTVDKHSIYKYKKIGINAILSQWATFDYEADLNLTNNKYDYDVSFVGSKNITREWVVNELNKKGINVTCFGSDWNNGKISYSKMKEIFYKSKINLNLSNSIPKDFNFYFYVIKKLFSFNSLKYKLSIIKQLKSFKNIEQIKARNFEIPGFGGFQLSKFALNIEDYYTNGREISVYSDLDDLIIQINYYLENDNLREFIRVNGYKKTKEHTYLNRIKNIFAQI